MASIIHMGEDTMNLAVNGSAITPASGAGELWRVTGDPAREPQGVNHT